LAYGKKNSATAARDVRQGGEVPESKKKRQRPQWGFLDKKAANCALTESSEKTRWQSRGCRAPIQKDEAEQKEKRRKGGLRKESFQKKGKVGSAQTNSNNGGRNQLPSSRTAEKGKEFPRKMGIGTDMNWEHESPQERRR